MEAPLFWPTPYGCSREYFRLDKIGLSLFFLIFPLRCTLTSVAFNDYNFVLLEVLNALFIFLYILTLLHSALFHHLITQFVNCSAHIIMRAVMSCPKFVSH